MENITYIYKYLNRRNDNMELDIFTLARVFLSFSSMTHKKLQKLCYYAQAWHLSINRERLINNEFEAWVHGPVCSDLYNEYREYGRHPIDKIEDDVIDTDSYQYLFIKSIYEKYGDLTGNQLEDLTHVEDPWINARKRSRSYLWDKSREVILDEDMMNYYT